MRCLAPQARCETVLDHGSSYLSKSLSYLPHFGLSEGSPLSRSFKKYWSQFVRERYIYIYLCQFPSLFCSNQTPAQSVQLHDAGFWDCACMGATVSDFKAPLPV